MTPLHTLTRPVQCCSQAEENAFINHALQYMPGVAMTAMDGTAVLRAMASVSSDFCCLMSN